MKRKNNVTIVNSIIISLVVLAVGFYLVQCNQVSAGKSEMVYLRSQINKIQSSNEQLEIEVASMQSMTDLNQLSKEMGFVKVDSVKYMRLGGEVARR